MARAETRALRVKLMNYEYHEEENKARNESQQEDILIANQELVEENERLAQNLRSAEKGAKSLEETYLSEIQRQEAALQKAKRDHEVLKEKCRQLN